jgi:hypothetical protein
MYMFAKHVRTIDFVSSYDVFYLILKLLKQCCVCVFFMKGLKIQKGNSAP